MAKKGVKTTMPTSTAQMPTKKKPKSARKLPAFTLAELMVVLLIVSLFVLLAMTNLAGLLRKNTFRGQAHELISALQSAASAASESSRRYEVIIDITAQSYLLRQITTPVLSQVLEEEIIIENDLGNNCRVAYVLFDDGEYTNDEKAKFRAGHAGWQYGGKIVLLDSDEQPYSVIVNRLSPIVKLQRGDAEILTPKRSDELLF